MDIKIIIMQEKGKNNFAQLGKQWGK